MKISELKKGDKATMRNVGDIDITGVAKHHINLKTVDGTMKMKIQFACNAAPLSDLGIEVKEGV